MNDIVMLKGARHVVLECGTCGVVHTMPEAMYDSHRNEGGFHTCPNGHSRGWTKEGFVHEKTRRERDQLKQQLAAKDDEIRAAEKKLASAETAAKKARKRIGNGVCPCCNRTVSQLARHMKSKHPTFAAAPVN